MWKWAFFSVTSGLLRYMTGSPLPQHGVPPTTVKPQIGSSHKDLVHLMVSLEGRSVRMIPELQLSWHYLAYSECPINAGWPDGWISA